MSDKSVANHMALFALTLAAGQLACGAQDPGNHLAPVVTEKIDESNLVVLPGNVRPEARIAEYDLGRVDDSRATEHVLLQLRRSPVAEHDLEQLIKDLENPSSPRYHQWVTPQQYGDQFGLADSDLEAVRGWLSSHGLRVNSINPARTIVDFSGNAGQLREAFHTELHALNVKGAMHIANVSDPQIPAALTPAVVGVVSLNNFRPHTNMKPRPDYTFVDSGTYYTIGPADLQTIYNLTPLYAAGITGAGTTVVVVEDTDVFATADWTTFRTKFGLNAIAPDATFTQVHPPSANPANNNCAAPGVNGAESEAILDAQWASASAPGANIILASCADTDFAFGGLLALANLLNAGGAMPDAVSMSYGECETVNGAAQNAAFGSVFQQAVAQGVAVFVSSGDEGAASCDANQNQAEHGIGVSGWASTPYNVAVGGTDFSDTFSKTASTYWAPASGNSATFGSAKSYIPEIPWNDSCASELFASFNQSAHTFGSTGFCNSSKGERSYLTTGSGSGGPSGCASGSPSHDLVVSGSCRGWAKPDWQQLVGVPDDGVRDIPDVSLFSSNGSWSHYLIYCDTDATFGAGSATACNGAPSGWPGAGGTSFASPTMAGIQALVNQKWGQHFGLPNQYYYSIADTEYGTAGSAACNSSKGNQVDPTCSFYDVTLGDIDVNCLGPYSCYLPSGTNGVLSVAESGYGPAYAAHTGWDFATGIGSLNAANLVNNAAWGAGASRLGWTPPHQ